MTSAPRVFWQQQKPKENHTLFILTSLCLCPQQPPPLLSFSLSPPPSISLTLSLSDCRPCPFPPAEHKKPSIFFVACLPVLYINPCSLVGDSEWYRMLELHNSTALGENLHNKCPWLEIRWDWLVQKKKKKNLGAWLRPSWNMIQPTVHSRQQRWWIHWSALELHL